MFSTIYSIFDAARSRNWTASSTSSSGRSSPFSSPPSSVDGEIILREKPFPSFEAVMTHHRRCDAIIFDLGDVLFTWSAHTKTSISPKTLHKILRTKTWFEYEKGNLTEEEAYQRTAAEFNLEASEVAAAFQGARDSLKSDPTMVDLIRDIKKNSNTRIFAMSNISAPDWEVLRGKATPEEWGLFDRVFTSAEARERKPNLGFFRQVIAETGIDPLRTAFVDDKLENVLSARSVGLQGIVFTSFEDVSRQLRNLVTEAVVRGQQYLQQNAKTMKSVTNNGVTIQENFAQLLILEATGDESLVDYVEHTRLMNFFQGSGVLTTQEFPCDLDTTSIRLTVDTHISEELKHSVMDEMLTYKNKDDIMQTYFDTTRPRIDPIVCANVLTLFYSNGRGLELTVTLDWVYDVLRHQAYRDGTLYYEGPDTFLFFLSRLLSVSPDVHRQFAPLFAKRVSERFGAEGDALALAMRIIAAATVQLCNKVDYERLLGMQEADGSWPIGWMYKYGATGVLIGNKGLTTALAVEAIQKAERVSLKAATILN